MGERLDTAAATRPGQRRALLTTLVFAGLRIGEALALHWDEVDLDRATITPTRASRYQNTSHPHSLRRTFASLLFALGESLPYVMAQMGHTTPNLTLAIYARRLRPQSIASCR